MEKKRERVESCRDRGEWERLEWCRDRKERVESCTDSRERYWKGMEIEKRNGAETEESESGIAQRLLRRKCSCLRETNKIG